MSILSTISLPCITEESVIAECCAVQTEGPEHRRLCRHRRPVALASVRGRTFQWNSFWILIQINPVHLCTPSFRKIHFNIILWVLSLGFKSGLHSWLRQKCYVKFWFLPYVLHASPISYFLICSPEDSLVNSAVMRGNAGDIRKSGCRRRMNLKWTWHGILKNRDVPEKITPPSSGQKRKVGKNSARSGRNFVESQRHYNPEHRNLHRHRSENLWFSITWT